ncbi:MAG: rhodanese-like domain-containing protein, partial [Acidimicrobiales bacterium]
ELADMLYDSLHNKLMPLPDATRVYPAHGAGSACGKNLSTETSSTMGQQRAENYALLAPDKQTFIDMVTEGQPPVPGYFAYDAILNRKDRKLLDENSSIDALSLARAEALVAGGAMLVDGRGPDEFGNGHLAGSVNVGLDGRYAEFAGSVVPGDVDIVLLVDEGRELEARNRLARIGFDRVVGYLESPHQVMIDNPEKVQQASRLTASELAERFESIDDLQLIDIRNPGEFALGAIDGAAAMPVGQMPGRLSEIDPAKSTVVYCAGGYRSSVAASYLRNHGFEDVSDLLGGYGAWVQTLA